MKASVDAQAPPRGLVAPRTAPLAGPRVTVDTPRPQELKKVLPSATDTVVLVGFTTAIPFAKDRRHAAPDRMRARYPRFSVTEVRADPLGGVNGAACGEQ